MSHWIWIRGKRIADEDTSRHCIDLAKAVAITVFGDPESETSNKVRIDFAGNLVFWCDGESAIEVKDTVDRFRQYQSST